MPSLLLINPRFPENFWTLRWIMDHIMTDKAAITAPLGLATLAALCPPDWDVRIIDEDVGPIPDDVHADVVGVGGMGVQRERQLELLARFRERGCWTVAGGSYASLCPEEYEGRADTVVAGEAEYIWPRFCADFAAGEPDPLYRETGTVDLADSPIPRYDLLDLSKYHSLPLQFSRGCPFRCDFCDIIVMFGRKPRTKAPAQVLAELDALRQLGVGYPFLVDDNFIGHRPKARELLTAIEGYQREHGFPFRLGTEASLDIASDLTMLEKMRDAGFTWLFTGIESSDPETLKKAQKGQNLRMDPLEAVRTIYAHSLDIYAGFIVGFDGDDDAALDRQRDFIVASGIQMSMLNLLSAIPKTPLYERMEREGRLLHIDGHMDTHLGTNLVPDPMEYDALVEGFRRMWTELTSDRLIAERVRNKLAHLAPPRFNESWSIPHQLLLLWRVLTRGILPGGPSRWYHFARSLSSTSVSKFSVALGDWARGLALRDYVVRHFSEPAPQLGRVRPGPPGRPAIVGPATNPLPRASNG